MKFLVTMVGILVCELAMAAVPKIKFAFVLRCEDGKSAICAHGSWEKGLPFLVFPERGNMTCTAVTGAGLKYTGKGVSFPVTQLQFTEGCDRTAQYFLALQTSERRDFQNIELKIFADPKRKEAELSRIKLLVKKLKIQKKLRNEDLRNWLARSNKSTKKRLLSEIKNIDEEIQEQKAAEQKIQDEYIQEDKFAAETSAKALKGNVLERVFLETRMRVKFGMEQLSEKTPQVFELPEVQGQKHYLLSYFMKTLKRGPLVALMGETPQALSDICSWPPMAFFIDKSLYVVGGSVCCDCGWKVKVLYRLDAAEFKVAYTNSDWSQY